MYITKLELTDFRCFSKASIEFVVPGKSAKDATTKKAKKLRVPNVNLLLGTNASGKSAILKALAVSVLGPVLPSSGFVPNILVRRPKVTDEVTPETAEVIVHQQLHLADLTQLDLSQLDTKALKPIFKSAENWTNTLVVKRSGDSEFLLTTSPESETYKNIFLANHPGHFIVAYGATRRVEPAEIDIQGRERQRHPRYQRICGLYEDFVALVPPATWVKHITSLGRQPQILELLNKLAPRELGIKVHPDRPDEFLYVIGDTELPFAALSDGYRAYLGWVGDLLFNLALVTPTHASLTDVPGVVIVDEIDLHLHPAWQQEVVEAIALTFPNLQFFFTTHSPLIATSLERENVLICEMDPSGKRSVGRISESLFGLSPDQVLTTDYFGLESVRNDAKERELHMYAKQSIEGDREAAEKFVKALYEEKRGETSL